MVPYPWPLLTPDPPLTVLKGIGLKRAALLARRGICQVGDLLRHLPIRYEDRRRMAAIGELTAGASVWVAGRVCKWSERKTRHRGGALLRVEIQDDGGDRLTLTFFHYRREHLQKIAAEGRDLLAYGQVVRGAHGWQFVHPQIFNPDGADTSAALAIHGVYSQVQGLSDTLLRAAVDAALEGHGAHIVDPLPAPLRQALGLPQLSESVLALHRPSPMASLADLNAGTSRHHRRLRFDRFLALALRLVRRKRLRTHLRAPALQIPPAWDTQLERYLGFSLTPGQRDVLGEMGADLTNGRVMTRLVQGDVGCGKTVLAAAATWLVSQNGWQTALMAPSQVLAQQHYESFASLPQAMGIRPRLLTAALTVSDRRQTLADIEAQRCNLIIGTHALLNEEVRFGRLGLVVIDEQQRFSVLQRRGLGRKGLNPHQLILSATPIPRTLAQALHACLSISVVRDLPAGRGPVKTEIIPVGHKRRVYQLALEKMTAGEQVLVVCPVIEGPEGSDLKDAVAMYHQLRKIFPARFVIDRVHGRMPAPERLRIMNAFRRGAIDLLVATTLIEVGIHAPGATLLVVEHPERFGLAQLHQLRGRIGRGARPGICLLLPGLHPSATAWKRMEALCRSHDGLEIAELDLALRGPGEMAGLRQAGAGDLDWAELGCHAELMVRARQAAEHILAEDPDLTRPEHAGLRGVLT